MIALHALRELEQHIETIERNAKVLQTRLALANQRATGPDRPNRKKLSQREVRDIRAAHRGGMAQSDLARSYGVNPATISRLVRGIYHR